MTGLLKNVLITGGTGFVGWWMREMSRLAEFKTDEMILTYQNRAHYESNWDLAETPPWDAIIHLAPVSPARVLDYAKMHGSRVLYASSGAVLGNNPNYAEYAEEKRQSEQMCAESGADVEVARLFSFMGEKLPTRFAIMKFIEQAKAGGPVILEGTGNTVRSYLHGSELGWWMWYYLFSGRRETIEIGGKTPYTMFQIARMVADVAGVEFRHNPFVDVVDSEYVPEHGMLEKVDLREAIERTLKDGSN